MEYIYSPYSLLSNFISGATVAVIVILAALYFLYSYGLYFIAVKRGVKYPFLAYIPVAQLFTLGALADLYNAQFENKQSNTKIILPMLCILMLVLMQISIVNVFAIVLAIAGLILILLALYKVYNWCSGYASLMLIFSLMLVPIPFFVFFIRKHTNEALLPVDLQKYSRERLFKINKEE